jgi:hypothetical protein
MKPLHASLTRISRCPCCRSKYACRPRASKSGKGAQRQLGKRELNSALTEMSRRER